MALIISKFANKCKSARLALYQFNKMIIRLSDLKPGQEAVITEFRNNEIFLKLMEMGCVPGEKVLMEQVAPLGDPVSVSVAGYHLSLRINEAEHILVELNH